MTPVPHHPKRPAALALAALLLATAGCHSKTAATPQNFTAALNAHFLDRQECLFAQAPRFPYETTDPAETKQMNALVASQLLTVEDEPSIRVSRYTPTTTGQRYAPRFCYGHRLVSSIESSTPPTQVNGVPQTQVTYRYTIEDVPTWAQSDKMRAAFPAMAQATSGNATDTTTLGATMAGWQVPD